MYNETVKPIRVSIYGGTMICEATQINACTQEQYLYFIRSRADAVSSKISLVISRKDIYISKMANR